MGIFDLFKKQLIDVIQWTDDQNGVLAYRFPMIDREIQNGAQLTVRDTQLALFVNEGKIADIFESGMHTLATSSLPVLTNLRNWDKGFQSPFKSDLYFFSTRDQLDQRWGTPSAIVIKDKQFGALRIRAHGTYSYRIKNPKVFFQKVSGTKEIYTTQDLEGQLRSAIITHLSSFLGKLDISFIDMAANQLEFSQTLKSALTDLFSSYGLSLESFFVQSVSLPEELQGHLDKLASMKMVGDLKTYAKFQAADSISVAAANESGTAGAGVGLGAGMAMAQSMREGLETIPTSTPLPHSQKVEDPMETISKLFEMFKKGMISQEEFDSKKSELLKKIN